ncbi:MAG: acetate kinase [Clostridia bacterium]|nr:acetate kinase [Clostridia bacterium]
MKILVLNSGSSSLKYQLIDMTDESVLAKGNFERIGQGGSFLTHKVNGEKYKIEEEVENHEQAIKIVLNQLIDLEHGVVSSLDEIAATGHRVVHGGEKFTHSVVVDDEVIEELKRCIDFAPLHNPAAIKGLEACKKEMPGKPMAIVVDTAFHQTIPEERYIYPIPYEYYTKYKIRKYGAHGTSHRYVANRVAELINKPVESLRIINCHLGQGASLAAIENGKCVDTTMGFTPLAGIAMGTRSGDLDPSVVTYLMKKENISPDEMSNILNKKSGLLGMSEISGDNRDLLSEIENNGAKAHQAELAIKSYTYIIAEYIAKCAVAMNGVDVISFSGGVGERGPDERKMICERLEFLGVKLDLEANKVKAEERKISSKDSKIEVWIVPTEEELMIARDTQELISK